MSTKTICHQPIQPLKTEANNSTINDDSDDKGLDESQLEESRRGLPIWDYFTKTGNRGENRAQCNFCNKVYNYSTTVANLKTHLARRHIDAFPDCAELQRRREGNPQRPRVPRTVSDVWIFFEKLENNLAVCLLCKKELSYRSTVHNLRLHLNRKHPGHLDAELEAETSYEDVQYLDMCNSEDSESSEQMQPHTEERLWRYFQREDEGRARCGLCEALVSRRRLRNHLEYRHSSLMGVLEQESDDEEEKPLAQSRKDPLGSSALTYVKKRESNPTAHEDRIQDECPPKKCKVDNHDSFLQYIGTLLEDTPRDLNLQLQMDIVNLIMKARLAYERKADEVQDLQENTSVQNKIDSTRNSCRTDSDLESLNDSRRVKYQVVFPEDKGEIVGNGKMTVESLVAEAVSRGLVELSEKGNATEGMSL